MLCFCRHKHVYRRKILSLSAALQDYMGGGVQPKQLVQDFLQAQGKSFAAAGSNQNTVGLEDCQCSQLSGASLQPPDLAVFAGWSFTPAGPIRSTFKAQC